MLIAHITDTHIRPKGKLLHHMVHTARALRRCIAQIESLEQRPDVVIATGDLVEQGTPREYRRLRRLLARLTIPLFVVPGNHDVRGALREAFEDHRYLPARGPLHYAIDTLPVRLVGLDTQRPGKPGGELDDERLAWLDRTLAQQPQRATFVFMHHPPFAIGVPPVDAQGFRGRERFGALVARHPQVVRVVCGHVHRHASATIGGALHVSVPSTSPQVIVARRGRFYGLRMEPAGYALHHWNGRTMSSTIRRVEASLEDELAAYGS